MRQRLSSRFLVPFCSGFAILSAAAGAQAATTYPAWVEGSTYSVGAVVSYNGYDYQALVYQTDYAGANWNPAGSPTLWKLVGVDTGAPAPTPTPTPAPSPGGCQAAAWSASAVYTAGALASQSGVEYKANWWTQGNSPSTSSGGAGSGQPWTAVPGCGSPTPTPGPTPPPVPPAPPPTPTPTPSPGGGGGTTGTLDFHLLLGVGTAEDSLTLDGDNYTDLILSNLVAGVTMGHLIQEYEPGIQYDRDFLYGSLFGQLLQENIETQLYQSSGSVIDPSPDQAAVMAAGQGGPYQINNYAVDMVAGTYTPAGHSLINYVALQKNIGFTMGEAGSQFQKPTPASFNDKYFGPMLTAYFHFNDFVALNVTGKGAGGWVTPWEPAYDDALVNFKSLPDNFLDVLLNAAYNQGYYGPLVASYSRLGATANGATVAAVDSFSSVWGKTDTYAQYPYQVRYYLKQLYDLPDPTTSATTLATPANHVLCSMTELGAVFANVFAKLAYVNQTGRAALIPVASAQAAFAAGLAAAGAAQMATLDLSDAASRATLFTVLEDAVSSLETSLGANFSATTNVQM